MAVVDPNPFTSRTVSVITGTPMEWSQRLTDDAGTVIPGTSRIGSTIGVNTRALIVYNNSSTETLCIECRTTALLIDGGTGLFPPMPTTPPASIAYIPPGGAFTVDIGPNGDRILAPWVYVQAQGAVAVTASFVLLNTSGNLQLGRG
jgi:hypothetical protein